MYRRIADRRRAVILVQLTAALVYATTVCSPCKAAAATPQPGPQPFQQHERPLVACSSTEACREAFYRVFGDEYGYGGALEGIVATGLQRFGSDVYVDYTGSAPYLETQIEAVHEELKKSMFGNPHSSNPSSRQATDAVDDARDAVLRFFGVTEATHTLVFTSGATGALRIVGSSFPWTNQSEFMFLLVNHNSVSV